jgi:hypothetical protein
LGKALAIRRAFKKAGGKQTQGLGKAHLKGLRSGRYNATDSEGWNYSKAGGSRKKSKIGHKSYDEGKAEGDTLIFKKKGSRYQVTRADSAYGFMGGRGKTGDIRKGQKYSRKRALSLVKSHAEPTARYIRGE